MFEHWITIHTCFYMDWRIVTTWNWFSSLYFLQQPLLYCSFILKLYKLCNFVSNIVNVQIHIVVSELIDSIWVRVGKWKFGETYQASSNFIFCKFCIWALENGFKWQQPLMANSWVQWWRIWVLVYQNEDITHWKRFWGDYIRWLWWANWLVYFARGWEDCKERSSKEELLCLVSSSNGNGQEHISKDSFMYNSQRCMEGFEGWIPR